MPAPFLTPDPNAMTCEEFLARHSDLLDGELTDASAVEMRLHMVGCERCARYDRVLRRGLSLLRESEPIQPQNDPYLALQQHIARAEENGTRRGPAVATLAAAAMLGFFAWSALDRMDERQAVVPADRTVQSIRPESLGFWIRPVTSGLDLVGPGLPVPARWPHVLTVGETRPGAIPIVLPAPSLDRGPYTPLVVQPPDYGQAADPLSTAPTGR